MRIALSLLLAIHGAIHLLGFLKAWKLASVPQLSGRTIFPLSETMGRVVGVIWLLACLVLLGAAALRLARSETWWLAAAAGVVVSQVLVILQWHDAKAGTVANILIAVAAVIAFAMTSLHHRADAEVRAMYAAPPAAELVRPQDLAGLPPPVRRWLESAGVVGREHAVTVRLRQRGQMHSANDAAWMPVEAEQYFTLEDPGFVWWMDAQMMKVLPLCGRDKYVAGKGEMLITVAGLIDVANERGPQIDQGAMLRLLAEIMWFPSAVLRPYIVWEGIDDTHAKATMSNHGVTASAIFEIDERGRPLSMTAERYFGATGGLEKWGGRNTDWRSVRGVEIPVRGEVIWHLKSGDFTFFQWEVIDVETNRPFLYGGDPASSGAGKRAPVAALRPQP